MLMQLLKSIEWTRNKNNLKAQISAEFFIIFVCVMMLLLIFTTIYYSQTLNLFQTGSTLSAKKLAYQVASAINGVYLAGNGASYNLSIPYSNESITLSGNSVLVEGGNAKVSAPVLTNNLNATNVAHGAVTIKNNNGLIEVG